ncbi:hypothetical protein LXA43DRAFT_95257 [Ganoderma leucocontextum]|nr:hypothetical protein LXA43DRAFT_95257 [Ganoderma leucocontextum]
MVNLSCRISFIGGDLLVLFVTWHKTYTSYKAQRGILDGQSLARVMLHNGSVYFIVITVMNIIDTALSQAPSDFIATYAIFPTSPVTAVLTCHFLLDLHQANRTGTTPSSPSASLNFAAGRRGSHSALPAFIVSMGSQVRTGLNFVHSMGTDEDVPAHMIEEDSAREEGLPQEDEGEIGMADSMPVEFGERV